MQGQTTIKQCRIAVFSQPIPWVSPCVLCLSCSWFLELGYIVLHLKTGPLRSQLRNEPSHWVWGLRHFLLASFTYLFTIVFISPFLCSSPMVSNSNPMAPLICTCVHHNSMACMSFRLIFCIESSRCNLPYHNHSPTEGESEWKL